MDAEVGDKAESGGEPGVEAEVEPALEAEPVPEVEPDDADASVDADFPEDRAVAGNARLLLLALGPSVCVVTSTEFVDCDASKVMLNQPEKFETFVLPWKIRKR